MFHESHICDVPFKGHLEVEAGSHVQFHLHAFASLLLPETFVQLWLAVFSRAFISVSLGLAKDARAVDGE